MVIVYFWLWSWCCHTVVECVDPGCTDQSRAANCPDAQLEHSRGLFLFLRPSKMPEMRILRQQSSEMSENLIYVGVSKLYCHEKSLSWNQGCKTMFKDWKSLSTRGQFGEVCWSRCCGQMFSFLRSMQRHPIPILHVCNSQKLGCSSYFFQVCENFSCIN